VDVLWMHEDLMVSAMQIELGEEVGTAELVDHRNRELVLDGLRI
jgi:hypothetical protein